MNYNPEYIEAEVQKLWKEQKIPEKIVKLDFSKKKFYLLDGPPYVNGRPHVGHAQTTTFKDVWGRFKFMQGHSVWFQPGFDCGGLPIENAVEKKLGIKSKAEIEEKIGMDRFIEECQKLAKGNEDLWLNFYKKLGAWRGWLSPYLTSENYYIESGWWTVKKIYENGLFEEGQKPGFWCPHCETVLSGYEASDSYKDVEDPSIFVKFKLKGNNEYLLVWTTTPWTLPGNVAVCVHPDEEYVKAKVDEEILILAEKRLEIFEQLEKSYTIIEKIHGKKLEGLEYEPILDTNSQKEAAKNKNSHRVILSVPIMKKRIASKITTKKDIEELDEIGHIVTMDTGSGIVHIAPGHGDVDNKIGKHYNLPEFSPVDEKGMLTEDAGEFSGIFVKKADKLIIEHLQKNGKLLHEGKIIHSYPLCWRCKSPLIYRMSRQLFLKIEKIRHDIIEENKKISWLPDFVRERFHNLLEEAPDWAITRQRYWGIPLPFWECSKCGKKKVIGSVEELKKYSKNKIEDNLDLHKNSVDKIKLKCECGGEMTRYPDIMGVWFDSGISPWASLGYPHKNKELFEKLWNVDLIDESQDQIRGWFYSLMVCGYSAFGKSPYKTVCMNGWTLDEKGEKMSKSLGNVVDAEDAYRELKSDLLRLYYCADTEPWEVHKFSIAKAKDLGRSLNILWNTYAYFKTYCKISEKKPELRIEDEWIISRLNSLITSATENMEKFNFHFASRGITDFIVNDFSRTYIKIIREREDVALNYTMTHVIENILKIMAPISPFLTEYLYHDMKNQSIHLEKWPDAEKRMINTELENDMKLVDEITNACNSLRKEKNIKLRWPLPLLVVDAKVSDSDIAEPLKILCNVEEVKFGKAEKLNEKEFENGKIYLDVKVDEEKALLRELLRAIQQQRKEKNLKPEEKIILIIENNSMKKFSDVIAHKVGAEKVVFEKTDGTEVYFEGSKAIFSFMKC